MKTVEYFLDRNLSLLLKTIKEDRSIGICSVQRICRIGYNQAHNTLEYGFTKGALIKDLNKEWLYRIK